MDQRLTGATSISRRNPNSRSQTIDAAENIAVNSTAIDSAPGYMKVRRLTFCDDEPLVIVESPVPSTKRNSTGWISDVTMRSRSRLKRIISRCHTTRTPRRSCRKPSVAGALRMTAASVGAAGSIVVDIVTDPGWPSRA